MEEKQTKDQYVENAVRAMRDMYEADGKSFNEEEARMNAAAQWEKENASEADGEPSPVVRNGGITVKKGGSPVAEDKKGRIRNALSSVLNGDAFKARIGRN